jgi:uncharacterized protein involved in exopolysaccharide biosynthesis
MHLGERSQGDALARGARLLVVENGEYFIDLCRLWRVLRSRMKVIIGFASVCSLVATAYAYRLPSEFTSVGLFEYSDTVSQSSDMSFLGLSPLVYASAYTEMRQREIRRMLEVVRTRRFVSMFLAAHGNLLEAAGWSFDDVFLSSNLVNEIVYREFLSRFDAYEIGGLGVVRMSFTARDPDVAKQYVDQIVAFLNQQVRLRDLDETRARVKALGGLLNRSRDVGSRLGLLEEVEFDTRSLATMNSIENYVFRPVDPPWMPSTKSAPRRIVMAELGLIWGAIAGIWVVFMYDWWRDCRTCVVPN